MTTITSQDSTPSERLVAGDRPGLVWRLHVVASPDARLTGTSLELAKGDTEIGRHAGLTISDSLLSRIHATVTVQDSSLLIRDCASRNGTFHGGRRIGSAPLGHGAVVRLGRTVLVAEADLGRARQHQAPTSDVPGGSEIARVVRSELELAASSSLPVLLVGETGAGKEHAAADLHARTGRRGPLVRFNVAAVPHNLFESELLGHVAGAFTGAGAARPGRVREAHRGCLVLDEIGELPLDLQPKLLRLLEERTVRPVGGSSDVPVDVFFVASTNANLDELVRQGRFRRDLLARLRGNVVHLPSLRERLPDLLDLADAVAPLGSESWRQRLRPDAVEHLLLQAWPDNLRGLRATLRRAEMLAADAPIGIEHLQTAVPSALKLAWSNEVRPDPAGRPSTDQLRHWLAQHRGNIDALAKSVGRHRRQVYRWLQYAGIDAPQLQAARKGPPLNKLGGGDDHA